MEGQSTISQVTPSPVSSAPIAGHSHPSSVKAPSRFQHVLEASKILAARVYHTAMAVVFFTLTCVTANSWAYSRGRQDEHWDRAWNDQAEVKAHVVGIIDPERYQRLLDHEMPLPVPPTLPPAATEVVAEPHVEPPAPVASRPEPASKPSAEKPSRPITLPSINLKGWGSWTKGVANKVASTAGAVWVSGSELDELKQQINKDLETAKKDLLKQLEGAVFDSATSKYAKELLDKAADRELKDKQHQARLAIQDLIDGRLTAEEVKRRLPDVISDHRKKLEEALKNDIELFFKSSYRAALINFFQRTKYIELGTLNDEVPVGEVWLTSDELWKVRQFQEQLWLDIAQKAGIEDGVKGSITEKVAASKKFYDDLMHDSEHYAKKRYHRFSQVKVAHALRTLEEQWGRYSGLTIEDWKLFFTAKIIRNDEAKGWLEEYLSLEEKAKKKAEGLFPQEQVRFWKDVTTNKASRNKDLLDALRALKAAKAAADAAIAATAVGPRANPLDPAYVAIDNIVAKGKYHHWDAAGGAAPSDAAQSLIGKALVAYLDSHLGRRTVAQFVAEGDAEKNRWIDGVALWNTRQADKDAARGLTAGAQFSVLAEILVAQSKMRKALDDATRDVEGWQQKGILTRTWEGIENTCSDARKFVESVWDSTHKAVRMSKVLTEEALKGLPMTLALCWIGRDAVRFLDTPTSSAGGFSISAYDIGKSGVFASTYFFTPPQWRAWLVGSAMGLWVLDRRGFTDRQFTDTTMKMGILYLMTHGGMLAYRKITNALDYRYPNGMKWVSRVGRAALGIGLLYQVGGLCWVPTFWGGSPTCYVEGAWNTITRLFGSKNGTSPFAHAVAETFDTFDRTFLAFKEQITYVNATSSS